MEIYRVTPKICKQFRVCGSRPRSYHPTIISIAYFSFYPTPVHISSFFLKSKLQGKGTVPNVRTIPMKKPAPLTCLHLRNWNFRFVNSQRNGILVHENSKKQSSSIHFLRCLFLIFMFILHRAYNIMYVSFVCIALLGSMAQCTSLVSVIVIADVSLDNYQYRFKISTFQNQ